MNRDQEFNAMLDKFSEDCFKARCTLMGGLFYLLAVLVLSDAFGPTPFLGVIFLGAIAAPVLGTIQHTAALKQNDRDWEAFKRKHYGIFSK